MLAAAAAAAALRAPIMPIMSCPHQYVCTVDLHAVKLHVGIPRTHWPYSILSYMHTLDLDLHVYAGRSSARPPVGRFLPTL